MPRTMAPLRTSGPRGRVHGSDDGITAIVNVTDGPKAIVGRQVTLKFTRRDLYRLLGAVPALTIPTELAGDFRRVLLWLDDGTVETRTD